MKFHVNRFSRSRVVTCRQTDRHTEKAILIGALFATFCCERFYKYTLDKGIKFISLYLLFLSSSFACYRLSGLQMFNCFSGQACQVVASNSFQHGAMGRDVYKPCIRVVWPKAVRQPVTLLYVCYFTMFYHAICFVTQRGLTDNTSLLTSGCGLPK
jgi:hypothetical protein